MEASEDISSDLIAVLCVYEEEALLPECLDSIVDHVDRIVVADGRYRHYPGKGGASRDKTLKIAREYGCEIIESPSDGWETEHAKRTALIQSGRLGDMYLVIDADEHLHTNINLRDYFGDFRLTIRGTEGTPGQSEAVRLFAHRDGMRYLWHFCVETKAGIKVFDSYDQIPKAQAWIEHLHSRRSTERVAADKEYEAHLVPFERALGAYG